jgi:hypothetical protein
VVRFAFEAHTRTLSGRPININHNRPPICKTQYDSGGTQVARKDKNAPPQEIVDAYLQLNKSIDKITGETLCIIYSKQVFRDGAKE